MVTIFITDDMFCHLVCYMSCSNPPNVYFWCQFFPSVVWRFSNILSSSHRGRKFVLNGEYVYLFAVGIGALLAGFTTPWAISTPRPVQGTSAQGTLSIRGHNYGFQP